jgi:hypothetical protein
MEIDKGIIECFFFDFVNLSIYIADTEKKHTYLPFKKKRFLLGCRCIRSGGGGGRCRSNVRRCCGCRGNNRRLQVGCRAGVVADIACRCLRNSDTHGREE